MSYYVSYTYSFTLHLVYTYVIIIRKAQVARESSQLKRFDLLGEARRCLARQVPTKAWLAMFPATTADIKEHIQT